MNTCDESGIRTTVSYRRDSKEAARELSESLRCEGMGFVLFFCSAEYDLESLGEALDTEFHGVQVVGCTTAGEITPDGYGQGCITAIGFIDQHFGVCRQAHSRTLKNFSTI